MQHVPYECTCGFIAGTKDAMDWHVSRAAVSRPDDTTVASVCFPRPRGLWMVAELRRIWQSTARLLMGRKCNAEWDAGMRQVVVPWN